MSFGGRLLSARCRRRTCSGTALQCVQVNTAATVAIVRHKLGCPTLMAQTRTRWPAQVR
jgi:hypothetical protein